MSVLEPQKQKKSALLKALRTFLDFCGEGGIQTIWITCLFKRKSFFQKMRVAPKVAPKFFSVLFLREGGMAAARAFRGPGKKAAGALTAGQTAGQTVSRHMAKSVSAVRCENRNPLTSILPYALPVGGENRGGFF
ncbi:MAG: hypothetical protein UEW31_08055 [Desulfovibrio sp.]|uniref:hypothetical protein n=1 Tax=Desulfovibrio sp. TaxID=885 RepID=UPI002E76C377|nr:hypothetical protein [Desulfovibrio sp.]MEE0071241.1 hypothetical protein [Desulfovibrio sp.]